MKAEVTTGKTILHASKAFQNGEINYLEYIQLLVMPKALKPITQLLSNTIWFALEATI